MHVVHSVGFRSVLVLGIHTLLVTLHRCIGTKRVRISRYVEAEISHKVFRVSDLVFGRAHISDLGRFLGISS